MSDNKTLAQSIAAKIDFEPSDDRILVKPMKPVMITKLLPTPPTQPARNIEEAEQQEPTEPTKQRVEANIQKGVVIKLGPDYSNPEVPERLKGLALGDIVYYPRGAGINFELLKDSRMLRRYEVLAIQKA